MINKLKEEIVVKLGREVSSRGDCELLSAQIERATGINLNYNTLRRFFRLDKQEVKARESTLDALSRFLGYRSYQHFLSFQPLKRAYDQHLKVYALISEFNPAALINYYRGISSDSLQRLEFLTQLCRHGLLAHKVEALCDTLDQLQLRVEDFIYNEVLILGNSVGLVLRHTSFSRVEINRLLDCTFFNDFIFSIFVDYSALNGYYLHYLYHPASNKPDRLLKYGLKTLRAFLQGKTPQVGREVAHRTVRKPVHPILQGRIFSLALYSGEAEATHLDLLRPLSLENLYEPMVASIISSNYVLFPAIKAEIRALFASKDYRHLYYFQVFFLLKACFLYKRGETDAAQATLAEIKPDEFRFSYKELLSFFYSLLKYHLFGALNARHHALLLCQKLNYPRFNENYIDSF